VCVGAVRSPKGAKGAVYPKASWALKDLTAVLLLNVKRAHQLGEEE